MATAEYRIRVSIREENVSRDHEEPHGFSEPGVDNSIVRQIGCDAKGNCQLAAEDVNERDERFFIPEHLEKLIYLHPSVRVRTAAHACQGL